MDKNQATELILTRLRAGIHPSEISDELSRILKAPEKVTSRFIDQVSANHPEVIPTTAATPPKEHAPDWKEPLPTQTEPSPNSASLQETISPNSDLPPGLQALLLDESLSLETSKSPRNIEPVITSEMQLPRQAEFVQPTKETALNADDEYSRKVDLESLSQDVLKQLKKQKRFNDIVEYVCQTTGWHWNKSQRFVARVKTKHHDELMSGRNRLTIVIGLGIIIVGLVMTLNGAKVLSDYAKLAVFARTNPEALFAMSPQAIFFALMATVTGIGMIIGGGFGIGRALTNR